MGDDRLVAADRLGVELRRGWFQCSPARSRKPNASAPYPARLAAPLPANHERTAYLRATLAAGADGETLATPIADQDSSLAKALARADALLVRELGAPPAAAGETCRIIRLAPLGA